MTVNDVSGKAIANLGWKEIKLTAPVFCGDTLYAESEVLEKRESKSRPTQGIVTVHTRAFNQDGVQVMEFVRSALIPKRGTAWTISTEKMESTYEMRNEGNGQ